MPKYVIEHELPGAGSLSKDQLHAISQKSCGVLRDLGPQIQWIESYVTDEKIYCIYRAPNEELAREHAKQGGFPANKSLRGHNDHRSYNSRMKNLLMWTVAAVLLSPFVLAQEHPSVTALPNTVYVGADGKFEANPDTAVIEFSISAQEETSGAAYDHASKEAEQVRQILRSNGEDPKTAQIGYFAIQPVYDYKTPKRKLVGYRVNTNVSVKLKDFVKIGPILQQLASADITDSQQLNYTLEDKDAAKSKAVEDAYRHARDSAEAVARAGARNVGDLIYASVDTFENPIPVRPMMMAATAPRANMEMTQPPTAEFSPQTVTITAHVNALFQLK